MTGFTISNFLLASERKFTLILVLIKKILKFNIFLRYYWKFVILPCTPVLIFTCSAVAKYITNQTCNYRWPYLTFNRNFKWNLIWVFVQNNIHVLVQLIFIDNWFLSRSCRQIGLKIWAWFQYHYWIPFGNWWIALVRWMKLQ